jgi:AcrR family transcriptional regulator
MIFTFQDNKSEANMTRRERLHQSTIEEIKSTARGQMAESGTTALSLNAIARAMEISTPGLYRYFTSRDDLVTALITDAYNDLADALEVAALHLPQDAYYERMMATVLAYRKWALAHPVDFTLIYGNPIPGYHAPEEVTTPAARRGFAAILRILAEAEQAGALRPAVEYRQLPPEIHPAFPSIDGQPSPAVPEAVLYFGLVGWTRIHGMLMLELFNHIQPLMSNTTAFYQFEMKNLLNSVGLQAA